MQWIQDNWLKLLAIVMLLVALAPVPYFAYYQLMNWAVVIAALVAGKQAKAAGREWLLWLMVLVGVIFNPVAPLYFRADVWQMADVVGALTFALAIAYSPKRS